VNDYRETRSSRAVRGKIAAISGLSLIFVGAFLAFYSIAFSVAVIGFGIASLGLAALWEVRGVANVDASIWRSQQAVARRNAELRDRLDGLDGRLAALAAVVDRRAGEAGGTVPAGLTDAVAEAVERSLAASGVVAKGAGRAAVPAPAPTLAQIEPVVAAAVRGIPASWARETARLIAETTGPVAVIGARDSIERLVGCLGVAQRDRVVVVALDADVDADAGAIVGPGAGISRFASAAAAADPRGVVSGVPRAAHRPHAWAGLVVIVDDLVVEPAVGAEARRWFAWLPASSRALALSTASRNGTSERLARLGSPLGVDFGVGAGRDGAHDLVILLDREADA